MQLAGLAVLNVSAAVPHRKPADDQQNTLLGLKTPSTIAKNTASLDGMEASIETTQQFLAWFAKIEEDMERGHEDVYRSYLASINAYKEATAEIMDRTNATLDLLDSLKVNYDFVENKTKDLQLACESLLDEQNHLIGVTEELAHKLAYFNELDPITRLLSAPGDGIVMESGFSPMLQKLDQCLAFVLAHPNYKDSDLYRMRYRQCMTRSMTLIKMHFVDAVRQLQNEIKERLAGRQTHEPLAQNMQLTMFYVKFRSLASRTRNLVSEIELRCPSHTEYFGLLKDCLSAYFSARRSLLAPFIVEHINSVKNESDLLDFASKGCAYIIQLCSDEYQLFRQFFALGDEEVVLYLESLATYLYDTLRPLIIRETRLDVLSEMCQSLQSYLSSFELNDELDDEEEDDLAQINASTVTFAVRKILEDAQQRLIFRAQAFLRQEIQNFKPREQELMVLARGRGLPQPTEIVLSTGVEPVLTDSLQAQRIESSSDNSRHSISAKTPKLEAVLSSTDLTAAPKTLGHKNISYGGGEWYPTLQRSLLLLDKLNGSVSQTIFEDLAQEIVDACRISLISASNILLTKQTKLDGQLFLIKNLLMLREQAAGFDSRFVHQEDLVNLSEMMDIFTGLMQNGLRAPPLSVLSDAISAATIPKVIHSYADAKEVLFIIFLQLVTI